MPRPAPSRPDGLSGPRMGSVSYAVMHYVTRITWTGNCGSGTETYTGYGRDHRLRIEGKPDVDLSADPHFRGDADRHNPEDLFLASLSSCHMLTYLALCAKYRISVLSYEDEATARLQLDKVGGGRLEDVTLHPVVVIARGGDLEKARALHEQAHARCFIASSVSVEVRHEATVREE